MKEAIAYFGFELEVTCPHCDYDIDLDWECETKDEEFYFEKFKDWINNISENINEVEKCCNCGNEFFLTKING